MVPILHVPCLMLHALRCGSVIQGPGRNASGTFRDLNRTDLKTVFSPPSTPPSLSSLSGLSTALLYISSSIPLYFVCLLFNFVFLLRMVWYFFFFIIWLLYSFFSVFISYPTSFVSPPLSLSFSLLALSLALSLSLSLSLSLALSPSLSFYLSRLNLNQDLASTLVLFCLSTSQNLFSRVGTPRIQLIVLSLACK